MISSISIRALLGITGCLRVSSPGSMPEAISKFSSSCGDEYDSK
jgi:hypothetical protein